MIEKAQEGIVTSQEWWHKNLNASIVLWESVVRESQLEDGLKKDLLTIFHDQKDAKKIPATFLSLDDWVYGTLHQIRAALPTEFRENKEVVAVWTNIADDVWNFWEQAKKYESEI